MYYPNKYLEEICYEKGHIDEVVKEIEKNFNKYFSRFIETEAGSKVTNEAFEKLSLDFGNNIRITKFTNSSKAFKNIINESIKDFEKDRESYLEILDEEALTEYEDDPSHFKNDVLRNRCPIIRLTIQNKKAKELDKYRADFSRANANDLLTVVSNLVNFANEYYNDYYDEVNYENINDIDELNLLELDDEEYYTVLGVIGGGIKSNLLYKLYPEVFPYRSREAIWALWFLTERKTFNCSEDSEFVMIDLNENTTSHNYFYPYGLFSYYAYQIYLLIKREALKNQIHINKEYRYVIVNAFLSYVAKEHENQTNLLRKNIKEEHYA